MKLKKVLALVMSLVILLALLPATALAEENTMPEVVSQQLNLGDDLTLKLFVKADSATVVNVTVSENSVSYELSAMEVNSDGYYVIPVRLAAAQMTEEITLDFLQNEASVLQKTYTIRDYAVAILEGNYPAATQKLVRSLLSYGGRAQQYFDVNTDNLADAGYELTDEVTLPTEYEAMSVSGSVSGLKFYGASLVFDNKIAVRYYFTGSVEDVDFGDYDVVAKDDMHYVEVPDINPQDYDKCVVLTAAKGEEALSISYSPLNYIVRMSQKGSGALKALLKNLYGYHTAAVEYVNNTGFFGSAYGCTTASQMDLSADTGANSGTVTVANDGISFGYIHEFKEENFYFEAKFHINDVMDTENWPKFGLFVQGEKVQDAFFVDMNRELDASVVGRATSTDGVFDWDNTKIAYVEGMSFSGEGENVTLGLLKDGKRLHLFVNGAYVMSAVCGFDGSALAGIFSFNTGMTVTEYFADKTSQTLDDKKTLVPEGEKTKGELFGYAVGDGVTYGTSNGIDISKDQGNAPSVYIYGGAPQYTYLNDVFTDKFCFETEINVENVLNDDNWPKFGIMVNGASEMVKFFVDMTPSLTATHVGVVYQPTGGGDDWGGSVSCEVPGMSFSGSDTVKVKLIRDGSAYYFYVNDAMVLHNEQGFKDEKGAVGIFSFNTVLTAKAYSVEVGSLGEGFQTIYQVGLTNNWFTDNGAGSYTLTTDSDAQHKVDDLTQGGIVMRKAYYSASGKVTLTDAADWGQARIIISADAQNEYYIALEKLPAGNYQVFTMSKAAEDNWNNWIFLGNTGKNALDFEVVVNGNRIYFLLNDLICYESDHVAMTESSVKFTGFNIGTTTVEDLSFEIFADSDAASAYIAGKEYKSEGVQETELSTNYFAEGEEGVYTLTTDSDAQHLVDDVLVNGLQMRESRYSLKGTLSLTNPASWGQARILISADAQNEYFIALEKHQDGHYQVFTMSKAAEDNWNNWVFIGNTGKNVHDFELVVDESKVYFLLGDLICYETEQVAMTQSTVKFTGFNIGTTTVENLSLKSFADADAVAAYIADKTYKTEANPETLLSTNYFTETEEGVYTLTTDSDAVHLVDDVLTDGTVMRKSFYCVQGKLSLTDANEWGQARILISADAQNEYFIALEKLPSGNHQIFSMSKANQDNWDVWEAILGEAENGSRNSIDFEVLVIGNTLYFLLDGTVAYTSNRVPMTECTVKFTGFNVGTTTVENLSTQVFANQDDAESYLAQKVLDRSGNGSFYRNGLSTVGADPSVIYITEGVDAGSYYMYITSDELSTKGFLAFRSRDLVNWERVGTALSTFEEYDEATGYTTVSYGAANYWAPEVIYDSETNLYYLFYSATRKINGSTRFYADIAVSETPAGPFVPYNQYLGKEPVVLDETNKLAAYAPVFDFANMDPSHPLYETNSNGYMKVIDMSPFVDPVTGKKYMYFCHDLAKELSIASSSIYVMGLNDDYTPDYTQVYALTTANSLELNGKTDTSMDEGTVNEAPYVIYNAESQKYYLFYSVNAYYQQSYSTRLAVADSPVGPFRKLTKDEGGWVLYAESDWTWVSGTGHCSVVSRNGQDYVVYHAHKGYDENETLLRGIAVDALFWVENQNDLLIPVVSGPTMTDTPSTADSYRNIAFSATVTATNVVQGTAEALTDGIISCHESAYISDTVFNGNSATIQLQFDQVQTVWGVAVYNGIEPCYRNIQSIKLHLVGGGYVVYNNLTNVWYDETNSMITGGSVALEFVPLEVTAVEIVMPETGEQYAITEIAVMVKR